MSTAITTTVFLSELPDADMLILWLDMERYKTDDPAGFINSRISYLLSVFKSRCFL